MEQVDKIEVEKIEVEKIEVVENETQKIVDDILKKKKITSEKQRLHLENSRKKKLQKRIKQDIENDALKIKNEEEEQIENKKKMEKEKIDYEENLIEKIIGRINYEQPRRDENKFYLF